jgi:hypothetical protein
LRSLRSHRAEHRRRDGTGESDLPTSEPRIQTPHERPLPLTSVRRPSNGASGAAYPSDL